MKKTNKPHDRQNFQFKKRKPSDAKSGLFGGDASEILREQLEYLKLELFYKNQQIQELEQELRETNQELCNALSSDKSNFDEAQEFARVLIDKNLPVEEALALMLTSIYGSGVKPRQLLPMPNTAIERSHSQLMNRDKFENANQSLRLNSRELICRLVSLKKQLAQLREHCQQVKIRNQTPQQLSTDRNLPSLNEGR